MALNESEILRRAQRLSSPTRRALSSGLEKALMSSRYTDNPNVSSMITRRALQGYGEGLSSAVSAGEREATDIMSREEQLKLERERIAMQRDAYGDQADAATISGITQLGTLGLMGYDAFKGGGGLIAGGGGIKTALGAGSTALGAGSLATMGSGALAAQTGLTQAGLHTVLGDAAFTGELANTGALSGAGLTGLGIGAAVLAAPVLGKPMTSAMKSIAKSLGMGDKTALSGGEWLETMKSGDFDTTGGYGGSSWNQWLANYKKGITTADPTGQLSRMTGLTLQESYDFGKKYNVPGFESMSAPSQAQLEQEARLAAQQWETMYGGG